MELKELVTKLIQQEFREWLVDLQFSGPFEEEDIDVDVILTERPEDLVDRSHRIRHYLREQDFDVLIDYLLSDDSAFSMQKKLSSD
ncbi:hypothetical protein FJZ31_25985 [Candidatus Poribacteria bacterium]|nr:hypothetical protein [Candidatus Poribacteria bacterium]